MGIAWITREQIQIVSELILATLRAGSVNLRGLQVLFGHIHSVNRVRPLGKAFT
jgi:hypothetical protein